MGLGNFLVVDANSLHLFAMGKIAKSLELLSCPASLNRLMEEVLRNIKNIIVYMYYLLVHKDKHDKHLERSITS
jgi:hypothetical protein